jgi:hypothetical protein
MLCELITKIFILREVLLYDKQKVIRKATRRYGNARLFTLYKRYHQNYI